MDACLPLFSATVGSQPITRMPAFSLPKKLLYSISLSNPCLASLKGKPVFPGSIPLESLFQKRNLIPDLSKWGFILKVALDRLRKKKPAFPGSSSLPRPLLLFPPELTCRFFSEFIRYPLKCSSTFPRASVSTAATPASGTPLAIMIARIPS